MFERRWLIVGLLCGILVIASGFFLETQQPGWKNFGSKSAVMDSNGLTGSETQWSNLRTVGETSWIKVEQSWNGTKIRFRGSATNTAATLELWGITGNDDGEYICDVNCTMSGTSVSPATMGGYYFDTIVISSSQLATAIGTQNCSGTQRMGNILFDRQTFSHIVPVVKSISNGTIYWDSCGY